MISSNYPANSEIARLTARMLLEVKAVHFNSKNPFILASGLPSPTYIDCRKLISFPRVRSTIMDFLTITVMRNVGFEVFDNVAGGETAGIPFAALVAERLGLPMSYIRKKPKGYGRKATRAANGIPAVSPPAILSKTSKPTLRVTVIVKKSMIVERTLG